MMSTASGNRALQLEEKLIFEQNSPGMTAVDLPNPAELTNVESRLGDVARTNPIGLPGLSEPQVVRHYLRLSQKNFAIDGGLYPLGSCTMKHNPRLNEKMARLPGLADIHPLQPKATVQGAYELIDMTAHWLKVLTGMPAVAMSPAAGAHGELCGLMSIRAALEARGDGRQRVLVPESAHGTNPASAHMCGYKVEAIPATEQGRVDLQALKDKLSDEVAAIMVTNPNTCGLFENEIIEMTQAVHDVGGLVYCDGANFNAIVGRVRPGDLGIDAMHLNLHKTFSTPHGGGGPGAGPVVLSDALAAYAPLPYVVHGEDGFDLIEHAAEAGDNQPYGRMKGFHGQFGVMVRALAYMLSMGSDGLRQASSDAVLNANYLMAKLGDILTPSYDGPCMHEVLFDDRFLNDTDVTTLDFAKAMIDEGFHPMTMYFPLVVHGALLMEPTETEGKATLDEFVGVIRTLAEKAQTGNAEDFKQAPIYTPRRRLDETMAARNPVLTYKPDQAAAAE
ncbi:MAG: aminomethyl-transferring glycine dehydrogenase subunit GcvPB [Rhodospirillaceae bacterium]|nr:aminomethyl-transferring glycine dehydrogenase subunit GcvPB [Rhodospirillaceae bacterium]